MWWLTFSRFCCVTCCAGGFSEGSEDGDGAATGRVPDLSRPSTGDFPLMALRSVREG